MASLAAGLDELHAAALQRYADVLREQQSYGPAGGRKAFGAFVRWREDESAIWKAIYDVADEPGQTYHQPGAAASSVDLPLSFAMPTASVTPPPLPPRSRASSPVPTAHQPPAPSYSPSQPSAGATYSPPSPVPASQPAAPVVEPQHYAEADGMCHASPEVAQVLAQHKANLPAEDASSTAQLAQLQNLCSTTWETIEQQLEAARSAEYSHAWDPEATPTSTYQRWENTSYTPGIQALHAGISTLHQTYLNVVALGGTALKTEDDLDAWCRAMESSFSYCERAYDKWNMLETERAEKIGERDSSEIYRSGWGDDVSERASMVTNQKIISAALSAAAATEATRVRTEAHLVQRLSPVLDEHLAYLNSSTDAITQVLLPFCETLPVACDPRDVDNVPALTPKATGELLAQLREAVNILDALALRVERIYDHLDRTRTRFFEATCARDADAIVASHLQNLDVSRGFEVVNEARSAAYEARSQLSDAHGREGIERVNEQYARKERRREVHDAKKTPAWNRVLKWERDARNELFIKAAQGPGGAQFLSNMMTMQHVSTMNVIGNMSSSGQQWEVRYNNRPY